jgi:autotransporter-associated beta strand protein
MDVAKLEVRSALLSASLLSVVGFSGQASAQDATWLSSPGTADFNTAGNWNPATVPTGTASFGFSNSITLSFSAPSTTIGGFTFNAGASSYTFSLGINPTLTFTGAGIVVNGGAAAFANNGNLNFTNSSTAGLAAITNTISGSLSFNDSSTAGFATINSDGNFNFNNSSTAGHATLILNGGLDFNDGSTAGSATITNNNFMNFAGTATAGNAMINNLVTLAFNGNSSAGNATIVNPGAITFRDSSTAANATIVTTGSGSTMFFEDTSSAGNATVITGNGGSTHFVFSSSGGNARLVSQDGGLITFAGLSTSGTTAGSIEGAGSFELSGITLTVGSNNLSTVVSGVIDGSPGSIVKVGSGTLTLAGINTYTGSTTVSGGALEVDGSIASATQVNSGARLSGAGTISADANISGTLAPGNATTPTGTLTVTGNLAFSSGALYPVQISGANAGSTNVGGTATLGGSVQMGIVGSAQGNHGYDILHAASGLNGTTFSGVQSLLPGFTGALSYSATDVFLNLTANLGGGGAGLGGNQQSVATVINHAFNSGGTLQGGFIGLFSLTGAPLSNALTQISGETATGAQQTTFNAMSQFMGLLTDPFMDRGGAAGSPMSSGYAAESAYAAQSNPTNAFAMFTKAPPAFKAPPTFEQRWSVWVAGYGGSQSTSGNAVVGSNNTTSSVAGTAVGADYLFSPNTIAGFALAGGGTSFSVANGGSGRSDLFQMGAYVRHTAGPAYLSAALAYGWQDITTNRTVTAAGIDQLRAEFNANAWSGRLEGGYRFVSHLSGGIGITPYAAAQFVTFDLPAYAEQAVVGTNNFALAYNAKDATDARSELGLRSDKSFGVTDGLLTLRGRAAWAHDYDPNRSIATTFQTLPGASFVVNGAAQASDSALTTASIEMKWRNNWSASATFEGEFSNVTSSYAGKGVVRYVW